MQTVKTRIHVDADHAISGKAPPEIPAGDHLADVTIDAQPRGSVARFTVHHGHWDDSIPLKREDIYGDDGR